MKALIIDDEPQIIRALRVGLERAGYSVTAASSGEEALDKAAEHPPEIVILDLAMPGTDGFRVCEEIRKWSRVPIIVLSVRDSEEDKIKALDLGADDYLVKPFGVGELLARMRAILRRSLQNDDISDDASFVSGDLQIDYVRRLVTFQGTEVHLTPKEYDLLKYMVQYRNRVLTHRQLLSKVWGPEYAEDTHTLRVHVANLRNKVEADASRPKFIHTETRIGYRFRTDD
ncbi:MAG: response regulator transcription factor [Candidatus Obscuribacterales bacterium]|jgi:two-component system KDP operon response regulator KdpE|nr:response regulator transcription factor [Candidatus Obscuribacterales bacterium]